MKVTVSFNTVKIVVPCGDGELTVRELKQLATTRYKKATGKPRLSWVSVHSLKAKEGGILDPDDRLVDVCDDREQLIAFYDEEGVPQGGDGMSASSDESESTLGQGKNTDIEVSSDQGSSSRGLLQVRRGSEPALNKLQQAAGQDDLPANASDYDEQKRWSSSGLNRDVRSSRNDLSIIAEASFYSESNFDPGGGKLSPLPPPFERGRGSGAARDSDRPLPFNRDANRLSIQICNEDGRWLEAAERAALSQVQYPGTAMESCGPTGNSISRQRSIDAKIKLFESAASNQRREPLGGTSPPFRLYRNSCDELTRVVIQNEIGPLGIHVVPSGDPENPGLTIQGIEPGGRIDRDGRLAVLDRIVEINGYSLLELPFSKAQEIFKDALFAKELQLVVVKADPSCQEPRFSADFFLSDENKENIENESETVGTLGRKLGGGPGAKLTSVVQAANTRKIGKKISINLVKGVNGLGFSITTRDIQSGGVTPIYIKHILPKGAAIENGQLKPGDRLLEINGMSVDGKSQSDVVALLRSIPQNAPVSLVVSRQEIVEELEHNSLDLKREKPEARPVTAGTAFSSLGSSNNSSTLPNSEESEEFSSISPELRQSQHQREGSGEAIFPWKHREILTLDIPVHDTERAGLGVSVKGKTTGGGAKGIVDLGIFVKNVINGGAASRDGRLRTNDQLVNINGISLLGKANCDAMDTLRRAMHEEGPTPGVITLTVARRLNIEAAGVKGGPEIAATATGRRRTMTGRDSVTSMLTSSSEGDSYREYRIGQENTSRSSMNNSSMTDTSSTSQNETVIYVEKPLPPTAPNLQPFDNFLAPSVPRNPVVDRLMGRKDRLVDAGLRNESYYRATGHDTWNATMLQQQLDTTDTGSRFQSPTVHKVGGRDAVIIEQYTEGNSRKSQASLRPHSPDGCEGFSERSSKMSDSDVAYASQTSLEEASFMFTRDQPGRQSMSEKRHATLDAKSTDTYQRSKRARQEREKILGTEKGPIGPMLGMKKSSSLESLQTMMTEMKMESGRQANRVKTSKVVRGRGCNESFRAAVDRSYEAQDCDDPPDGEVMATFGREDYRQSGSSLDSNADFKKKKNAKIFKGFGMFKFGKQRAKSTDPMRSHQDRKTPTPGSMPDGSQTAPGHEAATNNQKRDEEEEAARERMLHEQAKIQHHYKRLLQQRQESENGGGSMLPPPPPPSQFSGGNEDVYSGEANLPASLAAARPGSRTGITGTPSDPRFANFEEIQRHLSRRPAQYHSQRREHPSRADRPVSNFYEYESVQSAISHGRQLSGSGFPHSQSGLPHSFSPPRQPPPSLRRDPRQQHPPAYPAGAANRNAEGTGPVLRVAPLTGKYSQFVGRGDYEDQRLDYEDPYARLHYGPNRPPPANKHKQPAIQSLQVPKNNLYVPSLPPGSKV